MKHIKKIFSVLIILIITTIIFTNLISCQSVNDDSSEISDGISEPKEAAESDENTTREIKDDVPEIDFGGETFNMLIAGQTWATANMLREEITGEIVNDAQYLLKSKIEERFNVILQETATDDIWSTKFISSMISSGDETYDVYFPLDLYILGYAQQKMIYNWKDLVYINLSKPYWDSNMNKNLTINNNTYFAFGAYDLSYYDLTHVLVFNKDMIWNYGLEMPYNLVESGKWTVDKFREMAKKATFDVNGDGEMKKEDSYGMISVPKQVLPCFWIAAGELSIAKDAADYPYFNVPGNSKFYSVIEKLFEIMWDDNIWCRNKEIINFWPESVKMFSENRALFTSQTFYYLTEFRSIDADFGIVPYPKFTEDQERYYSRVEGGCKLAIVPITNQSPDKAGTILEAMACESYKTVIPQYYEVALKRKNSRDAESEKMLDLIFATRVYDLGDSWWCTELRRDIFADMFTKNERNLVSKMEEFEPKMNSLIEDAIRGFGD